MLLPPPCLLLLLLLLLLQMTFLDEQLPYLTGPARAALRGMDRKPISDLVA
jgi:hypothetical protein